MCDEGVVQRRGSKIGPNYRVGSMTKLCVNMNIKVATRMCDGVDQDIGLGCGAKMRATFWGQVVDPSKGLTIGLQYGPSYGARMKK